MTSRLGAPMEHRLLIDICRQHHVRLFWQRNGRLLISRRGITSVLGDLVGRGLCVAGLEGFELDGQDLHPRLDLIFNVGRQAPAGTPQRVIETWPDDVWVDVTIASAGLAAHSVQAVAGSEH